MFLVLKKLCRMFEGRGKFRSAFSETVDHQKFFGGKLMSLLFSADEESVPFCSHTRVSNNLLFVSCIFSALCPFSAVPQPGSSGKSRSLCSVPSARPELGRPEQPSAPTRARVNRAQEVTAAARNMRKAGQGRRKKESAWELLFCLFRFGAYVDRLNAF